MLAPYPIANPCLSGRSRIEVATIEMESGDTLFLYTDGLPEAFDHKREAFGTERIE